MFQKLIYKWPIEEITFDSEEKVYISSSSRQ